MTEQTPTPILSAAYTSPTNPPYTHTASLPSLPAPPSQTTAQKKAYLAALRQATLQMQEEVNRELTARMEEDNNNIDDHKRRGAVEEGGGGGKAKKAVVDEEKEEENYGEEVVEEED